MTVKFETVARRAGPDVRRVRGWLAFESEAITFTLLPQWQRTTLAQWGDVEAITFDDPGRTKADVGMIAVFGVAGMAARRSFSLVTITAAGRSHYFESENPVGHWRATAPQIAAAFPTVAAKIRIDGRPVVETAPAGGASVIDQIRQLGELRDSGLLTEEEFQAKKAEMLERL